MSILTSVHRSQHAGDKLVDAKTLLDEGDEGRDPALIVVGAAEVGENELLEGLNLVLKCHEVGDRLISAKISIRRLLGPTLRLDRQCSSS
jgi:hypothetical protein